ncbi:hypothetical protein [Prochlorococcus marinus]|uniref:hypothetical protein n=1 Tax=Prochlorococcus marinus TaxID=1219 RepID=UPI0022B534F8|nr:hypothetical protein [Prochlorococcus marinus]
MKAIYSKDLVLFIKKILLRRSSFAYLFILAFIFSPKNQSKADNSNENINNEIKWEKISLPNLYLENQVEWEYLEDDQLEDSLEEIINIQNESNSLEDVEESIMLIEPRDLDFIKPLRLSPSFPTDNYLDKSDFLQSFFSVSSFSGGAAGGTGNQNYSYQIDYGVNKNLQVSGFYSVADDGLYSFVNGNKFIPNYWEIYGTSVKKRIINTDKWSSSIFLSLESWHIRNGDSVNGNIFNNYISSVSSKNLIGSIHVPFTRKINDKIDLNFITTATFLPSNLSSNNNNFYGNNLYFGTGITWEISPRIYSVASVLSPIGNGNNSFNSSLQFNKSNIYNLGINWNVNPIIGIEGRITNGFGATPSTSTLTIPSDNQPLYFAGINYRPGLIDSPQRTLTTRERSLSNSGLTVATALVPPRGSTILSSNIDNYSNFFIKLGHSLSNAFQLEVLNLGSFSNVENRNGANKRFANSFMGSENFNTRIGGKFVLLSPLRGSNSWLSTRISVGRNQESKQGYMFYELINTYDINKSLAINYNPKIAWSGYGALSSFGVSTNLQLAEKYQFISELNLAILDSSETNYTFALRRLFNDYFNLDLYISSAEGIQDIGQFFKSKKLRTGFKLNIIY